ncbi:MAG: GNAT family N-acetyltransferase [Roseibium sp.]|nr:GNAT family N-acetyltransferase [Roseibium sp.]
MAVTTRPVTSDDCGLICRHRRDMFAAAGEVRAAKAAGSDEYKDWQAQHLTSGAYFGFIAEAGGRPVGGIGLMILDWPPHPEHPQITQRGYVLNLFVEPDCRGQGIGKRLIAEADREFRKRGVSFAVLTATDQARPIYEKDGWEQTSQMAKCLD